MSDPTNINEVILAMQKLGITVKKTASGAVRGNKVDKYADLASVNKTVLSKLNEMECVWICEPTFQPDTAQGQGRFVLRYELLHLPSNTARRGDYPLAAGDPQKIGSAITYGRRYALLAVIGVVAEDDDDDGQGGTTSAARSARPPKPRTESTVARADSAPPSLPSEARRSSDPNGKWTPQMMRKWMAQNREAGIVGDDIKAVAADMLGRQVSSSNEITFGEMRGMIDAFEKALKDPDTTAATVIEIYRRTSGSAPVPTAEQAETGHPPTKRAARKAAPAPAERRTLRESIVGTPDPNGEPAPWETEEPPTFDGTDGGPGWPEVVQPGQQ